LATATDPKRIKALQKVLKISKKVAELKDKLIYASPKERKALKAKLAVVKAKLVKAQAVAKKHTARVEAKKSKILKAKIAEIKKALKSVKNP
jgi:hypothetical protein